MRNPMTCPYLKEVVMLYCDACPFKKMVPLEQLVSVSPCFAHEYAACRHFLEAVHSAAEAPATEKESPGARSAPFTPPKEVNPS